MDEKDFAEVQHSQGEILVLPSCANVCGAKSLPSCLTLCHPMDCNPPGFSVLGILQARVLECVAMSFSKESSQPRDRIWVSWSFCIKGRFFTTEPLGNPDSTGAGKKKKKDFVSIGRSRTLPPIQQGTASQSWTSWQQCLPRSKGMGWLYAWLPQSVDFCRGIWFSFTAPRALKQGFPDWGREELGKTKIRIPLKGFVFCCFHDSCRKPNHDSVRTSSKDAHVWSELNSTP